ncbi:MAG: phage major capsid protein [Acidobacteriia bacterium]|nr:phage major capsid protein [Terriglobia bacterium]
MPELSKARQLREDRAKICILAQGVLDNAALNTEERNRQFDAHMVDADRLKAEIERHERIERLIEETRGTGAPPAGQPAGGAADAAATAEQADKDYRAAYRSYLKFGLYARPDFKIRGVSQGDRTILESRGRQQIQLTREEWERELRAVGGGAGITGGAMSQQGAYPGATSGFFVPVGFVDEIEQAMKYYGPMLDGGPGMPRIMPTDTGQPLPFPISNDTNVIGEQVDEQATVSQGVINMGNIVFGAFKFSTRLIQVSIELLQDSAFNIEDWLKDRFGERMGRILNTKATTGVGTTTFNGIVTAATVGPTFVGAGGNDGVSGVNTIGSDDFVSLEHALDIVYRRGAKYMMHDQTVAAIKKIKDKYGRPLWQPGIGVGQPDTINGYGYMANNDMDQLQTAPSSPGAVRKTVLFGQLPKYMIRRVKEMSILRLEERFAEFGQVAFLGFLAV